MPLSNLGMFYYRHEEHIRLSLRYPEATVVHDTVNQLGIDYYRGAFAQISLTLSPFRAMQHKTSGFQYLSDIIAQQHRHIVFPISAAEACAVAAYVMSQCQLVYQLQCWHLTQLTPVAVHVHVLSLCSSSNFPVFLVLNIKFNFWFSVVTVITVINKIIVIKILRFFCCI